MVPSPLSMSSMHSLTVSRNCRFSFVSEIEIYSKLHKHHKRGVFFSCQNSGASWSAPSFPLSQQGHERAVERGRRIAAQPGGIKVIFLTNMNSKRNKNTTFSPVPPEVPAVATLPLVHDGRGSLASSICSSSSSSSCPLFGG